MSARSETVPRRERPVIVGAGIGGLCLAVALHQRGFSPVVLESAPEIRPLGAGIWVPFNALLVLDRLGLAERVQRAGVPLAGGRVVSLRGGEPGEASTRAVTLQELSFERLRERWGFGTVAIHRAELHRVLLSALPPGAVRLGCLVESVSQTGDRARVTLRGGDTVDGDLVVGADGIRSVVRAHVAPDARLRPAEQDCARGVARLELAEPFRRQGREIWGGRFRFGFSEIAPGQVYWFAPWTRQGGGREELDLGALRRAYAGFPEPVPAILGATDEGSVLHTELADLAPLRRWHRGRVAVLGDAAHATTPNLGQGGAQAIEDALALAEALADQPSLHPRTAVEEAFSRYRARRFPVARRVVSQSRAFGRMAHWRHPLARALRDRLLRSIPESLALRQLARVRTG